MDTIIFVSKRFEIRNDVVLSKFSRSYHMCKELSKSSRILWVAFSRYGGFKKFNLEKNISVISYPYSSFFDYLKLLGGMIDSKKPKIVIATSDLWTGMLLLALKHIMRKEFVGIFDFSDNYLSYVFYKNPFCKLWGRFSMLLVSKYMDFATCVGHNIFEAVAKCRGSRAGLVKVFNGVDFGQVRNAGKSKSRKKLGLGQKSRIILYCGAMQNNRNVNFLLKSFKNIEMKREDVMLLMVGGGDDLKEIMKMSKVLEIKNIKFTGQMPYSQVKYFISASDICVIPNPENDFTHYSFPLKLVEYMACKKPVVASDVGEVPRVVKDRRNGLVFRSGSSEDFETKVTLLLDNISLCSRLGKKAYKDVEQKYTWKKVLKPLTSLVFNKLL